MEYFICEIVIILKWFEDLGVFFELDNYIFFYGVKYVWGFYFFVFVI